MKNWLKWKDAFTIADSPEEDGYVYGFFYFYYLFGYDDEKHYTVQENVLEIRNTSKKTPQTVIFLLII